MHKHYYYCMLTMLQFYILRKKYFRNCYLNIIKINCKLKLNHYKHMNIIDVINFCDDAFKNIGIK